MDKPSIEWPSVAVVVPVYNAKRFLPRLLKSLRGLRYEGRKQIILVDNGSTDGTYEELVRSEFQVLQFSGWKSSYACRNMGIRHTSAAVIAFTDADCRVDVNWLIEGVRALKTSNADMIAGRVSFEFRNPKSAWEHRDALFNMDNEKAVESGHAKTANLFALSSVFRTFEPFDEKALSGEDAEWTGRATRQGCVLQYCPTAVVYHPTRNMRESVVKAFRVGQGFAGRRTTRRLSGTSLDISLLLQVIRAGIPPNIKRYRRAYKGSVVEVSFASVLVVGWAVSLVGAVGIIVDRVKKIFG